MEDNMNLYFDYAVRSHHMSLSELTLLFIILLSLFQSLLCFFNRITLISMFT